MSEPVEFPDILFLPAPGIRQGDEAARCKPLVRMWEANAPVFGRVVELRDFVNSGPWGRCQGRKSPLAKRFHALGRGERDDCGSIVFEAEVAVPRFSNESDPIHGTDSARVKLRLEDHRRRSRSCAEVAAPMILHERARVSGQPDFERTAYASETDPLAMASPPEQMPRCRFFSRPEASAAQPIRPCEAGTYFVEDDTPAFGKLVELGDWVDASCKELESVPLGPRLYKLGKAYGFGAPTVDECGTVTYGGAGTELGSPLEHGPLRLVLLGYDLVMRDHRFRKRSPGCPAPTSLVELHERVYSLDGSLPLERTSPLLERRFFAPRVER